MSLIIGLSAAEQASDLKRITEEANAAVQLEKAEVETMQSLIKNSMNTVKPEEKGGCAVGGCSTLNTKRTSSQKESPLMDSKNPLIFVSSSMPLESLKRLAYQAVQHGAVLVIRGMVKGSMIETAKLVDTIDHPLEIDPKLFERFNVIKVPVFMIYHNKAWHKVSGNVNLNFSLEAALKDKSSS